MLQSPEPFDLSETIRKYLGPAIVGFFIFVLPAIRAAQAAKKQREEARRRALERGESSPGEAREGRQAWEDLLQGRAAPPATPPPLPVPVAQSRVPARAERAEVGEEQSLEDNPPPPLVELPSGSLPPAREGEGDEEESQAEEYVTARERQEALRQKQIAAAEYVASSPYRPDVAPRPASAVPIVALPRSTAPGAAEIWLFPTQPARDRRAALRRALVLREVLGPPLGLS